MSCFPLYLPSILLLFALVFPGANGFSIKLIHSDSPESPLYPGNLTYEERIDRLLNQAKNYINHMASVTQSSWNNTSEPTYVRPPVVYRETYYLAIVGIGTFEPPDELPYLNSYMLLDSGSDLIWTQCENCKQCYPQSNPLYPYTRSQSFYYLPCDQHQLCYPGKCLDSKCTYERNYADNAVSQGYLAHERFVFNSETGGPESVDVIFGCGFDQKNFAYAQTNDNPITGILGLGNGPRSLLYQLGDRAQGRMTYCIPHWREGPNSNTFIRFGQDAQFTQGQEIRTTPLIRGTRYPNFYYVELLDMSIAGIGLRYPPGIFGIRPDGKGGVVIDTGSPLAFMRRDIYQGVKQLLEALYGAKSQSVRGFDTCFLRSRLGNEINLNALPTITFHFTNADFDVNQGAYLVLPDYLCLCINPHDYDFVTLIIGNLAQSDYRFLINVVDNTVSFAKEKCLIES